MGPSQGLAGCGHVQPHVQDFLHLQLPTEMRGNVNPDGPQAFLAKLYSTLKRSPSVPPGGRPQVSPSAPGWRAKEKAHLRHGEADRHGASTPRAPAKARKSSAKLSFGHWGKCFCSRFNGRETKAHRGQIIYSKLVREARIEPGLTLRVGWLPSVILGRISKLPEVGVKHPGGLFPYHSYPRRAAHRGLIPSCASHPALGQVQVHTGPTGYPQPTITSPSSAQPHQAPN